MPALLEQLPSLSPDELRQVLARASALLDPTGKIASKPKETADPDLALIHDALNDVLRKHGESLPPLRACLRSRWLGVAFRNAAAALLSCARDGFGAENRIAEGRVLRLLGRLAADEVSRWGKPVTALNLARKACFTRRIVDRHFPGYWDAGLLPRVYDSAALRRSPSTE